MIHSGSVCPSAPSPRLTTGALFTEALSPVFVSHKEGNAEALCQPAYASFYANGHAQLPPFASSRPCSRVHQTEPSTGGA